MLRLGKRQRAELRELRERVNEPAAPLVIPEPKGEPGIRTTYHADGVTVKRRGYNIQQAMGLGGDDMRYPDIKVSVSAASLLDVTHSLPKLSIQVYLSQMQECQTSRGHVSMCHW